jgi:hypothetical protein
MADLKFDKEITALVVIDPYNGPVAEPNLPRAWRDHAGRQFFQYQIVKEDIWQR